MAVVDLVLADVAFVRLLVDAVFLAVQTELAPVIGDAAARQATLGLMHHVFMFEAGRDLVEAALALVDIDFVHVASRALWHIAEFLLAGLGPELLVDDERLGRQLAAGQECVDRLGGTLAVTDGINHDGRGRRRPHHRRQTRPLDSWPSSSCRPRAWTTWIRRGGSSCRPASHR